MTCQFILGGEYLINRRFGVFSGPRVTGENSKFTVKGKNGSWSESCLLDTVWLWAGCWLAGWCSVAHSLTHSLWPLVDFGGVERFADLFLSIYIISTKMAPSTSVPTAEVSICAGLRAVSGEKECIVRPSSRQGSKEGRKEDFYVECWSGEHDHHELEMRMGMGMGMDTAHDEIYSPKQSTNYPSKSPSQRRSSRSEGPPRLPERPSSRLPLMPVK